MPIYEYRCQDCHRRTSVLWRSFSEVEAEPPRCARCGSTNLVRLVSRVAILHSEESRLEDLADPSSLAGLDENDPRSIARWMRKMSGELGEDLDPEFDEVIDRLERGQSPEEIEESMPEMRGGEFGEGYEDEF